MSGATPTPVGDGPVLARPSAGGDAVTLAPEIPFRPPSLRAILGILVVFVVLGSVVYPVVVDGFARATGGFSATGTWVPGGNAEGLAQNAIGQNITNLSDNQSLFWERPSLTDYSALLGGSGEAPYGPTDPNLVNLTLYYIAVYGLNGTTAPLSLVSNSESGIDPDVDPAGALVQVPRVAAHTNLSEAFLTSFVQDHVQQPVLGIFGAPIVNVLVLDTDLLDLLHATRG